MLDAGASEVVHLMRRAEIPTVNPALLSAIRAYRDVDLDVTAFDPHAALQAAPAA